MAARIPRIARLTLYSGPNCSLCDIAKAELAKARQSHQFILDIVNIQDKGQEKDRQRTLGGTNRSGSPEEVGVGPGSCGTGPSLDSSHSEDSTGDTPSFFVDTTGISSNVSPWELPPVQHSLYERYTAIILGETQVDGAESRYSELSVRRCFNCGSPDHAVSSCPSPIDRQLVSLTRQLCRSGSTPSKPGDNRDCNG
ncbi:hypothetical protein SERLA73DRAFT_142693 [Serpula lacrymans var. lacrymans S7.3]|uniref:Glutaredoxin-like protein n=1 Tax=Serpula lacrymans var. lacrymans (strain S7.3) TaxID=936435 RepID=F8Q874_SERL3|nr:hypothetical protein SERLA73DRAFT_142693 [Serpula lacrymans var. lacrymans S7.3]